MTAAEFNPYKTLGIRKNAKLERIKRAFRQRSKQTHPDVGGAPEAFMAVRRAYFILSDPERRRKYDRDGVVDEDTGLTFQTKVAACQAQLFEGFVQSGAAFRKDLDVIKAMTRAAEEEIIKIDKARLEMKAHLDAVAALGGRIKRGKGPNLFHAILDRRREVVGEKLKEVDYRLAVFRAAAKELDAYECVTEIAQQVAFFHFQQTSYASST